MALTTVLINNLCNWPLGFQRIMGHGDIVIPANAKDYPILTYDEIQAQIQSGNNMFTGTDGVGSHARIQIVDDAVRKELFGIPEDSIDPVLLTKEAVADLLKTRGKAKFMDKLKGLVKTDAEKRAVVQIAEQLGLEDLEAYKTKAIKELADTKAI